MIDSTIERDDTDTGNNRRKQGEETDERLVLSDYNQNQEDDALETEVRRTGRVCVVRTDGNIQVLYFILQYATVQ
jgi:hypothetical protein